MFRRLLVDRDFYEVVIGVSEVQRANAAHGSTPLHRALLDVNAASLEWTNNGKDYRWTDHIQNQ